MKRLKTLINKIGLKNALSYINGIAVLKEKVIATNLDVSILIDGNPVDQKTGAYDFIGSRFTDKNALKSMPDADANLMMEEASKIHKKSIAIDHEKVNALVDAELLHKANVFASSDECRYILNGVFFDHESGVIVSTDGKRLYKCEAGDTIPLEIRNHESFILPSKTIKFLPKKGEIKIRISACSTEALLQWEENDTKVSLITKLVQGRYPNYKQVIPRLEDQKQIHFNDSFKKIFMAFTKGERKNNSYLIFRKDHMELPIASPSVFSYDKAPEEGAPEIALDAHFVLDAFNAGFNSMWIKDEHGASVMKSKYELLVVMPMRRA